jgi:hypothetical protein
VRAQHSLSNVNGNKYKPHTSHSIDKTLGGPSPTPRLQSTPHSWPSPESVVARPRGRLRQRATSAKWQGLPAVPAPDRSHHSVAPRHRTALSLLARQGLTLIRYRASLVGLLLFCSNKL